MNRFKLACVALIALLTAPLALAATPAVGSHPALHVTTLSGTTFDLAAQRGKWVIVNYWATWCGPCIKEMPDISAFVAAHADVTAIGLAYDEAKPAAIRHFLVKHPVVYPVARVDVMKPPAGFGEPLNLPSTFLVDPRGRIARHFQGPVTRAELARAIGKG